MRLRDYLKDINLIPTMPQVSMLELYRCIT